jgi:probable HAF family extracellular repeat protein
MKKFARRIGSCRRFLIQTIPLELLLLALLMVLPGLAYAAAVFPSYTVVDLGTLPGGNESLAYGINNTGQVVGDSTVPPVEGVVTYHGFLCTIDKDGQPTMTDLGTLGGRHSRARGINNLGQIAGTSEPEPYVNHAFRYTIGEDGLGNMEDLGALPGADASSGTAINNLGQVVGQAMVPAASGFWPYHAFLYTGSGPMADLGTVGAYAQTEAYSINDNGWVVGLATGAGGGLGHAFLCVNGVMMDIGAPLTGFYTKATGINNAGHIVGWARPESGGGTYAFLYIDETTVKSLGTLGRNNCYATGLNNVGQVVGYDTTTAGFQHPFLWMQDTMKDLTSLVVGTNPFAQLQVATAINDGGWITGYGKMPDNSTHAFLAIPGPSKKTGYVPYDLLLLDD